MGIIDNIVDMAMDSLRFKDTIFYKESSDLQDKYVALKKLNEEYPKNKKLLNELYIVKKGLDGENEISYELKKSHIGMYVLRDIKVKYEDLTAQIDYVIITPIYTYYVECKNLIGNITVTDKGDFVKEYIINGKKVRKGIYSPLRQVEAQREVMRKIFESRASKIKKLFSLKYFNYYRRVLVVTANQDTILNTSRAPKEIKNKILRSDSLVRQIEYDINHRTSDELFDSKKSMEEIAQSYIDLTNNENINYYDYYKNKFCNKNFESEENKKTDIKEEIKTEIKDDLRERLIELRKHRSSEMNIPAYYIFTNDELDKILEIRPQNITELKNANILTPIKLKTHGEVIINEINKNKK